MTQQDSDDVRLVELDDTTYREYRHHLVRDYAADTVRAGAWSKSEAESRATKDVDGLLPEGPATRNHFLYSVRDDAAGAEVGTVWFAPTTLADPRFDKLDLPAASLLGPHSEAPPRPRVFP